MGFSLKSIGKFFDPNSPAKDANKFERDRLAKMLAMVEASRGRQGMAFGRAEADMRSQLPVIQKAYSDANANVARVGDRQARTLLNREREMQAQSRQQAFRQGGAGSNLRPLVSRGVRSDTTRALAEMDQVFSQQYGQNAVGQANALSSVYGGLGSLGVQKAGADAGLTGMAMQAQGSQQYFPSQGFAGWLGLAGNVAKTIGSFGGIGGGAPGGG